MVETQQQILAEVKKLSKDTASRGANDVPPNAIDNLTSLMLDKVPEQLLEILGGTVFFISSFLLFSHHY